MDPSTTGNGLQAQESTDLVASQAASELQAFKSLSTRTSKEQRGKRRNTVIFIVVAVLLIVVAVIVGVLGTGGSNVPMSTVTVQEGTYTSTVDSSGPLGAMDLVSVTSQIDGTVGELNVAEGDNVNAGDVLFTIVNNDLDRQLTSAQRNRDLAAASVTSARTVLENTQSASNTALALYNQLQEAYKQYQQAAAATGTDALPETREQLALLKQQADAALSAYNTAQAQIEPARLQVTSAEVQLDNASSAVDSAQELADKRIVKAPISGQVVLSNLERGTLLSTVISTGRVPMQIADTSQVVVTLNINEVDILGLEVGQTAEVTFDAAPDYSATGVVHRIATASSGVAGTALGGIVTYPVEVLIANPSPRLKMGMTASVAIEVERIPDTLIVNALALYDVQDTSAKLLVIERDGTQREVTVTVLASNDSEAAIRGNIAEGATVSLNAGRSASASTSAGISLAATVG